MLPYHGNIKCNTGFVFRWRKVEPDGQGIASYGEMLRDGAEIIDIGGESTRPGYQKVTEDEEIERVVPYIRAVREKFNIPVSIDTYKAKVARAQ